MKKDWTSAFGKPGFFEPAESAWRMGKRRAVKELFLRNISAG